MKSKDPAKDYIMKDRKKTRKRLNRYPDKIYKEFPVETMFSKNKWERKYSKK